MNWGLADPEQDRVLEVILPEVPDRDARRRIAIDHQRKCLERARRFAEALDSPAVSPPGLKQYLIAGDSVPTVAVLSVDESTGAVEIAASAPGDGTVLRSSALMDERIGGAWTHSLVSPIRWQNVMFLFTDHLGMTKDPAFTDNVLYLLLEDPR
jgi:hypothetical protein